MGELKRGDICVLKRLLADLIVVVQGVSGDEVRIRFMDAPRDETSLTQRSDLLKLNDEQEIQLPPDLLGAVKRQREVIFSPKVVKTEKKKESQRFEQVLKKVDANVLAEINAILMREQEEGGT